MTSSPRSSTEGRERRSVQAIALVSLLRWLLTADPADVARKVGNEWRVITGGSDPNPMPPRFHLFGAPQRQGRKHA